MPEHDNISEIEWEANIIFEEMTREADILVEELFSVPIGMERMDDTADAKRRMEQIARGGTPEQRQAAMDGVGGIVNVLRLLGTGNGSKSDATSS